MGPEGRAGGGLNLPEDTRIAVVGLGYVGLEVACAIAEIHPTTGFDIDGDRIADLRDGLDPAGHASPGALENPNLVFTADEAELTGHDVYIVTVPTPIDDAQRPDLGPLEAATRTVAEAVAASDTETPPLVVYESTVYPGCTEETCLPTLEEVTGLSAGEGFHLAYSPERINPGDDEHTLETVVKVVGGHSERARERAADLYEQVVEAGVHRTPDLRTAEAAKVIENVQRDLNIALVNELAVLFETIDIDTQAVLEAAGTKWNFHPFHPGLVGGHCIPVDPYYLTHRAQRAGYHPEVILAGRRINDAMGRHVAQRLIKLLVRAGRTVRGSRVLIQGASFKADVPDARNSLVPDLVAELEEYGIEVRVEDPLVPDARLEELGLEPATRDEARGDYAAVVLAAPHAELLDKGPERIRARLDGAGVVFDVEAALDPADFPDEDTRYATL